MWRKKLWLYHVAFFATILIVSVGHWPPRSSQDVTRGVIVGLVVVIVSMAFPQVMFKPQERTLTVNENGLDTKIGKKEAHIGWNEISRVAETHDTILIIRKRTGNALIIPKRAFRSEQEREAFYKLAKDLEGTSSLSS